MFWIVMYHLVGLGIFFIIQLLEGNYLPKPTLVDLVFIVFGWPILICLVIGAVVVPEKDDEEYDG